MGAIVSCNLLMCGNLQIDVNKMIHAYNLDIGPPSQISLTAFDGVLKRRTVRPTLEKSSWPATLSFLSLFYLVVYSATYNTLYHRIVHSALARIFCYGRLWYCIYFYIMISWMYFERGRWGTE